MKKTILYATLLALSFQSCDYLDREPLDSVTKDQFFTTATGTALQQYCNNFYPKLIKGHGDPLSYSFGMLEKEFESDNIFTWEYNVKSFGLHVAPTEAKDTEWQWENIRACNDFLMNYQSSPATQAEKNQYAGEIYFFKCLDYFNKLSVYGDVPWYTTVLNPGDEEMYKGRDSRILVADSLLLNIEKAINLLSPKSKVGVSRVSKDAAIALKARMCLFEGTWRRYHNIEGDVKFLQEAYDAAGELMKEEYGYSIFKGSSPKTAYHELFTQENYNNNSEVILAKEYDPSLGKGNNVTRQIGVGETPIGASRDAVEDYLCATTGKPISLCGCEGHTTHTGIIAELENRDPRLLQTIATPKDGEYTYYLHGKAANIANIVATGADGSSSTGYAIAKFYKTSEFSSDHHKGSIDAPIFRYGEILLIRAEAGAELGVLDNTELGRTINELRKRVGFNYPLTVNPVADPKLEKEYPNIKGSNANLIREIRRERRIELFGEGYRYDDLRRWACGKRLDASVVVRAGIIPDASLYTTEEINSMKEELGLTAEGALDIYGKRVKTQAVFEEPKHYLLSIPINEISINPNLAPNNPGW